MNRAIKTDSRGQTGLYVHVPFCTSKCPYCDFNSVAISGAEALPFEEARFINCLCTEFDTLLVALERSFFTPATLYFGGGTPSLLSPASVARFIKFVTVKSEGALPAEITIEANPESITSEKLSGYLKAGVNRLSIGVQSFNGAELRLLGRPHTVTEAVAAFKAARAVGFGNIGIDLMFGLPEDGAKRRLERWKESLAQAIRLAPEHISLYGLTIEESTPFHALYSGETISGAEGRAINDELYTEFYSCAIDALTAAGYEQYEISNFSRPGRRSRHNSLYWSGTDEYIGLGPGAHSLFYDTEWGQRSWNVSGVKEYFNLIENAGTAVEETEVLDRARAMLEAAMLGLRQIKCGITGHEFKARFGVTPFEAFVKAGKAGRLIDLGLLYVEGDDLRLTRKGLLLSDTVIAELY